MAANDDDDQRNDEGRNRTRRDRRDVLDIRDGRGSQRSGDQRRRDLGDDESQRNETSRRSRSDRDSDERFRGRERDQRRREEDDDDRADDRDDRRSDDRGDRRSRGKSGDDRKQDDKQAKQSDDKKSEDSKGGTKDGKEQDSGEEEKKSQEQRRKRRPIIITIVVIVALLLVGGGIYYWLSTRGKVNTDDAYTDGNVVTIAPQVSGQVISLQVNDNQFVHKGDILVRIDPRQFQYSQEQSQGQLDSAMAQVANQKLGVEIAKKNFPASLQLAQANLQSAKANLSLQQANFDRQKSLPKAATTQQDVDTTSSQYQQAQAQVAQEQARLVQAEPVQQNIGQSEQQGNQFQAQAEQAQGQLDQAKLNVEWATVRAPQDGWVTRRNVNAGNYVSAGTQIMSLVTTDTWVTANYKETELNGMHLGQKVTISVDAYPDLKLEGHVDSIQHGSGSKFSAFPAENATGNFVKIVQRVPVKIVIDSGLKPDQPLPLGISVEPTVMLQ